MWSLVWFSIPFIFRVIILYVYRIISCPVVRRGGLWVWGCLFGSVFESRFTAVPSSYCRFVTLCFQSFGSVGVVWKMAIEFVPSPLMSHVFLLSAPPFSCSGELFCDFSILVPPVTRSAE